MTLRKGRCREEEKELERKNGENKDNIEKGKLTISVDWLPKRLSHAKRKYTADVLKVGDEKDDCHLCKESVVLLNGKALRIHHLDKAGVHLPDSWLSSGAVRVSGLWISYYNAAGTIIDSIVQ